MKLQKLKVWFRGIQTFDIQQFTTGQKNKSPLFTPY